VSTRRSDEKLIPQGNRTGKNTLAKNASTSEGRLSARVYWAVGTMAAAALILIPLGLVMGALVPGTGRMRVVGQTWVPPYLPWFVILPLLGAWICLVSSTIRRSGLGRLLLAAAALPVIGTIIIGSALATVARSNGATISLTPSLSLAGLRSERGPDGTIIIRSQGMKPLAMDVYRPPRNHGNPRPILFAVHGGGWVAGSRDDLSANWRWFADHGWIVVSTDYTLSGEKNHQWAAAAYDIDCALAWVANHAARLGGDPSAIAVFADSAGAKLAINAAYRATMGRPRRSCAGVVPKVAAVVASAPLIDLTSAWREEGVPGAYVRTFIEAYIGGSPRSAPAAMREVNSYRFINPAAPPTLFFLPEHDIVAPVAGSDLFIAAAAGAGIHTKVVRVPYSNHAFNRTFHSVANQALLQITATFVEDQLAKKATCQGSGRGPDKADPGE
jgi:acetyl esterase/lipase